MFKKILLVSALSIFLFVGTVQGRANDLPDPGMLPDSPFYFLKGIFEGIGTFFTFGEANKAERFLNLAEKRLSEAKALAEKGRSELVERAVERHQEQLGQALAKAEQARAKGLDTDEVLAKVSEANLRHQAVLADVYERVSEQARPAIERAMEAGMRGHEQALQAISGEKREEIMQQTEERREEANERIQRLRERVPVVDENDIDDIDETEREMPVEIPTEAEEMVPEILDELPEMPVVPGVQGR